MKTNSKVHRLFALLILLLSVSVVSCGGGSSSNGSSDNDSSGTPDTSLECSEEFGDDSRCNTREGL